MNEVMISSKDAVNLIEYVHTENISKVSDYLDNYDGSYDGIIAKAFLHACRIGSKPIVTKLLDHVNPNVRNGDGFTGLMLCMEKDSTGVLVSLLLDRGCDPNLIDASGRTPLHYAVKYKNTAAVRILLKMGVNVNAHDKTQRTPLMYAAQCNAPGIIYQLVHAGADPVKATKHRTVLHAAVRQGSVQAVRQLLPFSTQPDALDTHSMSPLFLAVHFHHKDIVELFLQWNTTAKKIDINRRCKSYPHKRSPIEEAAVENQTEIVRLLLEAGADPNEGLIEYAPIPIKMGANSRLLDTATQTNASNRRIRGAPIINNQGSVVSSLMPTLSMSHSSTGYSQHSDSLQSARLAPLMSSVESSYDDTNHPNSSVHETGNRADDVKPTPAIFHAIAHENKEMLDILIRYKAIVNLSPKFRYRGYRRGTTPLLFASELGRLDLVKTLITASQQEEEDNQKLSGNTSRRAWSIDGEDSELTPLTCAAGMAHYEVVGYLLKMGANPSAPYPHNIPALVRLLGQLHCRQELWPRVYETVFANYPTAVSAVLNREVAVQLAKLPENAALRQGFIHLARHTGLPDFEESRDLRADSEYVCLLGRYLADQLGDVYFQTEPEEFFDIFGAIPPRLVMLALRSTRVMKSVVASHSIHSIFILVEGLVDFSSIIIEQRLNAVEYAVLEDNIKAALMFAVAGGNCRFLHCYSRLTFTPLAAPLGTPLPQWIDTLLEEMYQQPRGLQQLCVQCIRRSLRPKTYLCTEAAWKSLALHSISPSTKINLALLKRKIMENLADEPEHLEEIIERIPR